MIYKYTEFLLEKLILESDVIYSDKFRTILSRMKEDKIAEELLKIENKDLDVVSNFFDVKIDNDNVVTFTPDRIAQQILNDSKEYYRYVGGQGGWLTNNVNANGKIFEILGFVPKTTDVYRPNNTELGEIQSKYKSKKSGKTWCYVKFPGGEGVYNFEKLRKEEKDLKKVVFTKNRQEIRTGRAIRLLLTANGVSVTDSEIEKFVNGFRAILSIMNDVFSRFDIVEGDDLGYWYNRKNYLHPGRGTMGSSCQAVGRLDWLEIYIKNPETVKLLILRSEENWDKIIGRSLLWKLDNGETLMDFIYTSNDSDEKVFKEYAKSKGWHTREECDKTFTAYIKPGRLDAYPSVDTMNRWNPETGQISNKSFPGSEGIIWTNDDDDDDDDFEDFEDDDF
jgi:hypothetical protein